MALEDDYDLYSFNRKIRRQNQPKIKSLSINNFKPFSDIDPNIIQIKPITLLYGWNNSGKSSILELIQLLSSLSEPNSSQSLLQFNANYLLNIGSYKNFIHENNLDKNLKIKFEIENIDSIPFYETKANETIFINKLLNSKSEVSLEYTKSHNKEETDLALLKSFNIEVKDLISLKASKVDELPDNSFKIQELDLSHLESKEFFDLIKINRQKIISNLEELGPDIRTADINPWRDKESIGYKIRGHVSKIEKIVLKNSDLLYDLFMDDKLPSSFFDDDQELQDIYFSEKGHAPYTFLVDMELGIPEPLSFFLQSVYGTSQYADLNEASQLCKLISHNPINQADLKEKGYDSSMDTSIIEDYDTSYFINNVEKLMSMLDWNLLDDEDYVALLEKYFIRRSKNNGQVKLDKKFWDNYVKFLPIEFREGFVTAGKIHEKFIVLKGLKKHISPKKMRENRDIVAKFLSIEADFIIERTPILYEDLDDIIDACQRLKAKFSKDIKLAPISESKKYEKVPTVKIAINEYEKLLELLKNWSGNDNKQLIKIKEIFFKSFKKSLIFKSNYSFLRSMPLRGEACLTLSSFIMSYIEIANNKLIKDNVFYQSIDNLPQIINTVISSARRSLRARTFNYPNEAVKRFYEKKDSNELKRPTHSEKFSYEYVFNILMNNPDIKYKVNESLKKMGFDFEINFELLKGIHDESIFYSLAKNINNKKINTNIADIGLGLKKIIPLVTYLFHKKSPGLICIQEPESNLHPKYQSEIAEVIAQSYKNKGNSHIIETHSEILILRLLKLIKQKKLRAEDISVNFIEKVKGQSKIINIGVNDKGEFTSNWPKGFFNERIDELI